MSSSVWIFLHSSALLFNILSEEKKDIYIHYILPELIHILPCDTCKTNYHLILQNVFKNIVITNSYQLFDITVQIHNEINKKLNAPTFTTDVAIQFYTKKIDNNTYDLIHPMETAIWECFFYSSNFFNKKIDTNFDTIIKLFKTIISLFYLPSMDSNFLFSVLKTPLISSSKDFCYQVRALFYMNPYATITLQYQTIEVFNTMSLELSHTILNIDVVTVTKEDKSYILTENEPKLIYKNIKESILEDIDLIYDNNSIYDTDNIQSISFIVNKPSLHVDSSKWPSILIDKQELWSNIIKPFHRFCIYNPLEELTQYTYDILTHLGTTQYNVNIHLFSYEIIPFDLFNSMVENNTYTYVSKDFFIETTEFLYIKKTNKLFEAFDFLNYNYKYDITVELILSHEHAFTMIQYIQEYFLQNNIQTQWFLRYTKGRINELISNMGLTTLLKLNI
jgi:hypothetical protein